MTDIKQAFTPYAISLNDALFFSIPLYQRLFEWGEEQITQLLDDLYSSYKRDNKSPYYIGMLTTKELGNNKELVETVFSILLVVINQRLGLLVIGFQSA